MLCTSSVASHSDLFLCRNESIHLHFSRSIFGWLQLECKNDKDGKFRGMAVVAFETPMEALQAISMFNGQTLFDRNMSVKMDKLANMEDKKPSLPGEYDSIGSFCESCIV